LSLLELLMPLLQIDTEPVKIPAILSHVLGRLPVLHLSEKGFDSVEILACLYAMSALPARKTRKFDTPLW
jgi:hypothetical protein